MICFKDNPDKRVADYGVFTALFNSGMILSCSNYDTKAPKAEIPPEPVVPEVPPEEKVEDKKKEAAMAKGKKKGKAAEVEAPPVVSPFLHNIPFFTLNVITSASSIILQVTETVVEVVRSFARIFINFFCCIHIYFLFHIYSLSLWYDFYIHDQI